MFFCEKLMRNRRGLFSDISFTTFLYIPVIILVALFLVYLSNQAIAYSLQTSDLESQLFVHSLLLSPRGVSVYDPALDRVFDGTIDLATFSDSAHLEAQLREAFQSVDPPLLSAELKLTDLHGKSFESQGKIVSPILYQKTWFERWVVLSGSFLSGKGTAHVYEEQRYVFVRTGERLVPGLLTVRVLIPES